MWSRARIGTRVVSHSHIACTGANDTGRSRLRTAFSALHRSHQILGLSLPSSTRQVLHRGHVDEPWSRGEHAHSFADAQDKRRLRQTHKIENTYDGDTLHSSNTTHTHHTHTRRNQQLRSWQRHPSIALAHRSAPNQRAHLWSHTELVEKGVVPDLLHVLPVCHNACTRIPA